LVVVKQIFCYRHLSWDAALCSLVEVYWCFRGACWPTLSGWLIALLMEVASTSEMSVNFYHTTWCNNPEDSHLHTCHHKILKFKK
jgi:hypothetical protein